MAGWLTLRLRKGLRSPVGWIGLVLVAGCARAPGPVPEPEAARPGFALVRSLVDELGLEVCSMGMTADLSVALEEGSTEVRVGTALFGPRPPRR